MAATSALRGYVLPDVPGCPVPMVDRAITVGAREWCDLTQTVRETVSISTVAGTQSYAVTPASGYDIARVFSVAYDTKALDPIADSNLQTKLDAIDGEPSGYWMEGNTLYFDRVPLSVVSVSVEVAIKPQIDSTTIPDPLILGEHSLAIAARAKRELMMSKASWGDPNLAQFFEAEFQRLARNNVNTDIRNLTNAPLRSRAVFA